MSPALGGDIESEVSVVLDNILSNLNAVGPSVSESLYVAAEK